MPRVLFLFLPVLLSVTTSPSFAQDPVKVDPAHHEIVLENDQVRVLRITFGPNEKTPEHEHPTAVAIMLTDAKNRLTRTGGKPDETPRKRGDVVLVEAGKHTVENLGAKAEIILVELKDKTAAATAPKTTQDPVKLDTKHYKVQAENDRVRVLRVRYGPKEKSVAHEHPVSVAVLLTEANFQFTSADGKVDEVNAKRGDVLFRPRETHTPENLGAQPAEVVLVELKGAGGKGN